MEGTSIVSVEFILAILVILAALLVALKVTMTNRLRGLEDTVYELTEENEALQKAMKETQAKEAEPVAAPPAPAKEEAVPVVEAKPVTNHLVPVGQRNLAVVAQPVVEEAPQGINAIPEAVIAVIMAAVAAMGYSPAAIRAIRPKQRTLRRNRNWVMAGRMANMK